MNIGNSIFREAKWIIFLIYALSSSRPSGIAAVQAGLSVALIGKSQLGDASLNRGCIAIHCRTTLTQHQTQYMATSEKKYSVFRSCNNPIYLAPLHLEQLTDVAQKSKDFTSPNEHLQIAGNVYNWQCRKRLRLLYRPRDWTAKKICSRKYFVPV